MIVKAWLVMAGVGVTTWILGNTPFEPAVNVPQPHVLDCIAAPQRTAQPGTSQQTLSRLECSQIHMGTRFIIILYAADPEVANRAIQAAFARIEKLNQILSDYATDSELNRLCRQAPTPQEVPISEDLFRVLQHAQQIARRSDGAFDVTVGPLTKLWRRSHRKRELPSASRLAAARQAVDYRYLQLNPDGPAARLLKPDMRLDLGGIAKGYAVDQALAELTRRGICRALVNASGDMAASGPPPDKPGWRVAIAPLQPDAPPSVFGNLVQGAIATSGDAFQFVEIAGVRYSHIVDPRTGRGLTDRSSVSILASNCMTADGLASATTVLGPRAGLQMIEKMPNVEAFVVMTRDSTTETRKTPGFAEWISGSVAAQDATEQ